MHILKRTLIDFKDAFENNKNTYESLQLAFEFELSQIIDPIQQLQTKIIHRGNETNLLIDLEAEPIFLDPITLKRLMNV